MPLLGLTPQGWMRQWDERGLVSPARWNPPDALLDRADAVILSQEDVGGDREQVHSLAARTRVLVLTAGWKGATVYHGGEIRSFRAPKVREVDPTGAGDIFATAYLAALHRTQDPWLSARFANCVAAHSVERSGLDSIATREEIEQCRARLDHGLQEVQDSGCISRMTRIYALANQKGGVGKTTTAVNLAAYLSTVGLRVLLVDVDPQANATSSLGIDKNQVQCSTYHALVDHRPLAESVSPTSWKRLYVAPSSPSLAGAEVELVNVTAREYLLRQALAPIAGEYDYVLIDCPPSLGLLTVNALAAAMNGVIVPIQCEYLALEGLTNLLATIDLVRRSLNPNLAIRGMLMTMYDPRTNLSQQVVDEVRRHFSRRVFKTVIPRSVRLGEAPSYGKPIMAYGPSSPGAHAYQSLTVEILTADGWQFPQSKDGPA